MGCIFVLDKEEYILSCRNFRASSPFFDQIVKVDQVTGVLNTAEEYL